ncbi:2OG-Fe(II) oxygenase [Rhizobiaceae bacterium]|nr:2OG-Fe(II) oxygenase [Rhizobiaceae bacterium]
MTVLTRPNFIAPDTLTAIQREAHAAAHRAYFTTTPHTVFLTPPDPSLPDTHVRNRMVTSSKGCICDDDVPAGSPLRALYESDAFRGFIMEQTGETALHPYADPLSSINVHYAERGQELGWHFDNSEFAITLLIQKPDAGGRFEYVPGLRDSATGEVDEEGINALLDGRMKPKVLDIEPGTLVLFRGRDAIHRVSPNESDTTRILAVLAYNSEPGIALSEDARMTFYGRLN